jgi:hypothetical protein
MWEKPDNPRALLEETKVRERSIRRHCKHGNVSATEDSSIRAVAVTLARISIEAQESVHSIQQQRLSNFEH